MYLVSRDRIKYFVNAVKQLMAGAGAGAGAGAVAGAGAGAGAGIYPGFYARGEIEIQGGDSKILKIKFQFYAVIFYISRGGEISYFFISKGGNFPPPWLHWENP